MPIEMDNLNISDLQKTAIKAALEAGRKILEVYESDDFGVELKSDSSPLTKADLISQQTINRILHEQDEGIPILGEEGREFPYNDRKSWNIFWLVDPLDGTKEFVRQNGEFTVNIALVEGDHAIIGVLYVPVKDMLYFAAVGCGAFKAGKAAERGIEAVLDSAASLPLNRNRTIPPVKVVASRSHFTAETESYVEKIRKTRGEVELVNAGSSLKICLVAEGTADVYPRFGPTMEWDVAAGQVIAEEAGCSVSNAETAERLCYNKPNLLNPYFIVERKEL
jgi:3'(2'), 5'-bisphosphate nucleotidase